MTIPNKVAWIWHYRDDLPERLAATGHNGILLKAGVDGNQPVLWTAGVPLPAWAQAQWTPAICQRFLAVGITPMAFVYVTFGQEYGVAPEIDAIVRLCRIWLPTRIGLNYEVETDGMTDAAVDAYFDRLEAALAAAFGAQAPALDNSSVPSWDGDEHGGSRYHRVPYRAVSRRTVIDYYQNYWGPQQVTGGWSWEDGFEQFYEDHRPDKLVLPIAPAYDAAHNGGQGFTDGDMLDFARWCRARGYPGFATWEAGNAGYLWDGVAAGFRLFDDGATPARLAHPLAWRLGGPFSDRWRALRPA